MEGKRVLVVDMDSQGNATSGLGFSKKRAQTVMNLLQNEASEVEYEVSDVICKYRTDIISLDLIPANKILVSANALLASLGENKELVLKNVLDCVDNDYDIIVIDTPPALDMLTINALGAADFIIIPVQPTKYGTDGLADLTKLVLNAQKTYNPGLKFGGIVYTIDTATQIETRNIKDDVEQKYGNDIHIFEHSIPRLADIANAPSYGVSIFDLAPSSKAAWAYTKLVREVLA